MLEKEDERPVQAHRNTNHQGGRDQKDAEVPAPTRTVTKQRLRRCWIATMEAPITGPMADFEQCYLPNMAVRTENTDRHQHDDLRWTEQQLEADPYRQRHFDSTKLIEPSLQSDPE